MGYLALIGGILMAAAAFKAKQMVLVGVGGVIAFCGFMILNKK